MDLDLGSIQLFDTCTKAVVDGLRWLIYLFWFHFFIYIKKKKSVRFDDDSIIFTAMPLHLQARQLVPCSYIAIGVGAYVDSPCNYIRVESFLFLKKKKKRKKKQSIKKKKKN